MDGGSDSVNAHKHDLLRLDYLNMGVNCIGYSKCTVN